MQTAVTQNLRYTRGFVLSQSSEASPHASWEARDLHGWVLSHDPQVAFHHAEAGHATVSVLGLVIDTATWSDEAAAVRRAAEALADSEGAFLDVVDSWSGRYLIVWQHNGRTSVMTDAAAVRTCFYNLDGPHVLSSHLGVVAQNAGARLSAWRGFQRDPEWVRGITYFPGRLTPWEGLVFLTANCALDLDSRELRRVWPRRPLQDRPVSEVAEAVGDSLARQMRWLVETGRDVVVSLTGGVDSRTTFAASRAVRRDLTFFTYAIPGLPSHVTDMALASEIAAAAEVQHVRIDIPSAEDLGAEGEATRRVAKTNSFLSHFRPGVEMYRRNFSRDAVHVRSNVAEIGRRFFDKAGKGVKLENPTDMAQVWKRMGHVAEAVSAFDEWAVAARFFDVSEIDLLDLFYWEHRMSCWHGCVVLESDLAFDTHVPFSCYSLLEALLSVPIEARQNGDVFTEIVRLAWPEIASIPYG